MKKQRIRVDGSPGQLMKRSLRELETLIAGREVCHYCGGPMPKQELIVMETKAKNMCRNCMADALRVVMNRAIKKGGRTTTMGGRLIIDMPKKRKRGAK